jgi:regulator-associated protein of mTOR
MSLAGTPPSSSPGVRVRGDSSYEPLLHIGADNSALGGVFASADAARVGGGLYHAVVEALCALTMDPAPPVMAAGAASFQCANLELVPGAMRAPSAPASPGLTQASSLPMPSSAPGASSAGVSSLLPKSWQAKSWRGYGPAPTRAASSHLPGSTASSAQSSPTHSFTSTHGAPRAPVMLRRVCWILATSPLLCHSVCFAHSEMC